VKERVGETTPMPAAQVECSVEEMLDGYAQAMARLPWTEAVPAFLSSLRIVHESTVEDNISWYGVDATTGRVDLPERFMQGWHILSVSGGQPIMLFGLWDSRVFLPLSFFYRQRFYECFDSPSPGLRWVG
jgi:hypothetical protein